MEGLNHLTQAKHPVDGPLTSCFLVLKTSWRTTCRCLAAACAAFGGSAERPERPLQDSSGPPGYRRLVVQCPICRDSRFPSGVPRAATLRSEPFSSQRGRREPSRSVWTMLRLGTCRRSALSSRKFRVCGVGRKHRGTQRACRAERTAGPRGQPRAVPQAPRVTRTVAG